MLCLIAGYHHELSDQQNIVKQAGNWIALPMYLHAFVKTFAKYLTLYLKSSSHFQRHFNDLLMTPPPPENATTSYPKGGAPFTLMEVNQWWSTKRRQLHFPDFPHCAAQRVYAQEQGCTKWGPWAEVSPP